MCWAEIHKAFVSAALLREEMLGGTWPLNFAESEGDGEQFPTFFKMRKIVVYGISFVV